MLRIGKLCLILQAVTLPIHAWVAVVNMLCNALGNAVGAFLLATARQGTCFIPIVHLMAWLLGEQGVAGVQAVADVLSLLLAIPIAILMTKKVRLARKNRKKANFWKP